MVVSKNQTGRPKYCFTREQILAVYEKCHNWKDAAKELGVSLSIIYRRKKEYDIHPGKPKKKNIVRNPQPRQSKYKTVTCPDCGYQWRSRGKGNFYKCPRCYTEVTGRRYGEYFIKTKGLTSAPK
jgi:tRNA(Ile2) C34 agmatinyltransferase TiaS